LNALMVFVRFGGCRRTKPSLNPVT
jgi:hypothetical protein